MRYFNLSVQVTTEGVADKATETQIVEAVENALKVGQDRNARLDPIIRNLEISAVMMGH